ncbi:MAG: hypothetical protein GX678_02490 [Actinomycetales bacterium]|nr:hypothetical protein [Actinomycetales bacterium]
MSIRIILATSVMVAAGLLAGCSSPSEATDPAPKPSSQSTERLAELAGSWHDEHENWTVHFSDDGTFTEDFQGNLEVRTGLYTVVDGVVTLEGGDGNSDKGTVKGDTIEFRLGTLKRMTN